MWESVGIPGLYSIEKAITKGSVSERSSQKCGEAYARKEPKTKKKKKKKKQHNTRRDIQNKTTHPKKKTTTKRKKGIVTPSREKRKSLSERP